MYGCRYKDWKEAHQQKATEEQIPEIYLQRKEQTERRSLGLSSSSSGKRVASIVRAGIIELVTQVVQARHWTLTPAVAVEALPTEVKERALAAYAAFIRESEADVLRAMEDSWGAYQLRFGFVLWF